MKERRFNKIAFIAGTLGTGGAERQLFYLLRNLKNSGYEPLVICLSKGEFWESKIIDIGIKVIYAGENEFRFSRLLTILRIIRAEKPNLIYSFHFYTNIYAGIIGRLLWIASLGSIRSNGIQEKNNNNKLSWFHYALPRYIISNSEHGKRNCFAIFYKKPLFILQNAIDLEVFPYKPNQIIQPHKFIFVGRFENPKQPWLFPEFIKLVHNLGIPCDGEMYGDGFLKESINNIINKEYSNYNIKIFDTERNIQNIYRTADCLVMVSHHEGSPNVVIEAMASGLIVATLKIEGITDIITPDISGIVENSLQKLALKIVNLLANDNQKKQMTESARRSIEINHSLKAQIKNFEAILLQLK